jgi:hypothetical protein
LPPLLELEVELVPLVPVPELLALAPVLEPCPPDEPPEELVVELVVELLLSFEATPNVQPLEPRTRTTARTRSVVFMARSPNATMRPVEGHESIAVTMRLGRRSDPGVD